MRKSSVPGLTKTTLFVFATLLLSFTKLHAQLDIAIGAGNAGNSAAFNSSGYPCPLQDAAEASRMQFLYKASELNAMGMVPGDIRSIRFTVTNVGTSGTMENVVFKIGTTSTNSLSTSAWDVFLGTPVATAPGNFTPANGVNTITFPTPFAWNGTNNILIEICNGDPSSVSTTVK